MVRKFLTKHTPAIIPIVISMMVTMHLVRNLDRTPYDAIMCLKIVKHLTSIIAFQLFDRIVK